MTRMHPPVNLALVLMMAGCAAASTVETAPTIREVSTVALPMAGGLPATTHVDETDRFEQDLTGTWRFRFDDADTGATQGWSGETDFSSWETIAVPAAWDLAHPDGFNRQAPAWYALAFTPGEQPAAHAVLAFEGVFREADVWLNGEHLGRTEIAYLPFSFDITKHLVAGRTNHLVLRIDNRLTLTTLPCDTTFNEGKHGWMPYGGITRRVAIRDASPGYASAVTIQTALDGSVTAFLSGIRTGDQTSFLQASIELDGKPLLKWPQVAVDGETDLRFDAPVGNPRLWSDANPGAVYELALRWRSDDREATDRYRFAFRKLEATNGRFYLNGNDIFLFGMNRHEETDELGPVYESQTTADDLELLAELGTNFIRPGHYPNDVRTLQDMEAAGLLIAEEIPVYQWDLEQMRNPEMIALAKNSLRIMQIRDYNRPGVVIWSVANEIHNWVESAPAFIRTLYEHAKKIDARPVMVAAATIPPLSNQDISSGEVDVIGVNEYWGWYVGETRHATGYLKQIHELFPDKTFVISEYGAGASVGTHIDGVVGEEPVDSHTYSEAYQVYFHERHLDQFASLPFIRGVMPWAFADFRFQWAPTTGHPFPMRNLKGLVSLQREKKAAFGYVAQRYRDWPN